MRQRLKVLLIPVLLWAGLLIGMFGGRASAGAFDNLLFLTRDTLGKPVVLPGWAVVDTGALNDSIATLEARMQGYADTSEFQDSVAALAARIAGLDTLGVLAQFDTLNYNYGIAGDTTSPGFFYFQAANDSCYRSHPDSLREQGVIGVAVDSVNKGAVCRFRKTGRISISWYNFPVPGIKVVNDSVVPGGVVLTDSLRTNTKKMRTYGWTTTDSTTIDVKVESWFGIWEN